MLLTKVNTDYTENANTPIPIKEIKYIVKNFPKQKTLSTDGFIG